MIESAELSQCGIDGAGSVGSHHDKDIGTCLHTVHEGQQL
jgi:hypothetical protein